MIRLKYQKQKYFDKFYENIDLDINKLNSVSYKIALVKINEVLSTNPGYKEIKILVDFIEGKRDI